MDPAHHRNHQQSQKTTTPTPQDTWHNERFQPIVNIHDLHPTRSRIWQPCPLQHHTATAGHTGENSTPCYAIRICLRIPLFAPVHHSSLLHHAKLPTLSSRLLVKQALLAWDICHQTSIPHLQQPHLAPQRQQQPYTLRQTRTYSIGHAQTNRHRDSPINSALTLYNSLPIDITTKPRRNSFRNNASSLLWSSTCSCSAHPLVSDISNVYLTISITPANVIAPLVFHDPLLLASRLISI